jgi:hypothetical protein
LIEQCSILGEKLQFFDKLPPVFQESFCKVFGTEIRDEKDIFFLTNDFSNLMWENLGNGRIVRIKDIYCVRGDESALLTPKYNKHHWPPSSVGGKETIKLPVDFHHSWHVIFMNLYKEREINLYLKSLCYDEEINNFSSLYEAADKARNKAKIKKT